MSKQLTYFRSLIYIFLLLSLILSIGSFWILRDIFLADIETTILLSGFLLAIFLSLFYKRQLIIENLNTFYANEKTPYLIIGLSIILICFSLLIYYSFVAILLRMPVLFQDEWNLVNKFLFSESIISDIFSRYNHHPSYLLNAFYAVNLYFLKCNELWFLVINVASILGTGTIYFKIVKHFVQKRMSKFDSHLLAITSSIFSFWILGANNVFWNMPYVPVFAAVLAIYGLSLQEKGKTGRGLYIFISGGLMISISFGMGAIIWILGPIASILKRQKLNHFLGYLFMGVLFGAVTMGAFSVSNSLITIPELSNAIQALPIYLGKAITTLPSLSTFRPSPMKELLIGSVGITLFISLIYKLWHEIKGGTNPLLIFGVLLSLFSIGCSVVIMLGRMEGNLSAMLAGRYTIWSSLFWVGLFLLLIPVISQIKSKKRKRNSILLYSFCSILFIAFFNNQMINKRFISLNIGIRAKTDILVHQDGLGNETMVYTANKNIAHIKSKIIPTSQELKKRNINIYKNDDNTKLNSRITDEKIVLNQNIVGYFNWQNDKKGNYFFEGYIPDSPFTPPHTLIISLNRVIVGYGFPYSDYYFLKQVNELSTNPIKTTSHPFQYFPGLSRYYYGQFFTEEDKSLNQLELFGLTRDGNYLPIKSVALNLKNINFL